ncbi:hypothetical protein PanWU01x14_051930 [Parasponia andersonii]|uniref:Uncharacterized protein n=1 Tax=Parasponia andersonii TaxID=3476 RepID=A0A2P5DM45_PARAD|nr:hypothetical protein PanWU01x14_051930 [Parasponia andersonii]
MGKWDSHRLPRRIFRQQNPWRPPPVRFDSEPVPDNVPSWEKRFCYVIGRVPWRKVVDTKKFMCCHTSILEWDDSAVEEAFQNAKKRFWAEMKGIGCDISLPDPDVYIHEIDWNPVVDPELMKELDQEYFVPDEEEGSGKLWGKNKKSRNSTSAPSDGGNTNPVDNANPWECNNAETSGISESKDNGWNQWNNHSSVSKKVDNNDNSWGCNVTQGDGDAKDNEWVDQGKKSWGQNLSENLVNQSRGWDTSDCNKRNWDSNENPWDCGFQSCVSRKDDGWGLWDKSWGLKKQDSNNMGSIDDPWVHSSGQHGRAFKDGGWRDNGGDTRGGKNWNHYSNQNRGFNFRRTGSRHEVWNEDFRNRDGSYHNVSGYRNSRR